MNLAERISNGELEIMRIPWWEGEPVSFADTRTVYKDCRGNFYDQHNDTTFR
jgi:hypothetical protein